MVEFKELLDTSIYPISTTIKIQRKQDLIIFNNVCRSMGLTIDCFSFIQIKDDLKITNILKA